MKNKFVQSLFVATVTTVIAASTAFAAIHWSNETGEWKYLDKNNNDNSGSDGNVDDEFL